MKELKPNNRQNISSNPVLQGNSRGISMHTEPSLPNSANQKSFTQNFLNRILSLSQHFCFQQSTTPSPRRGIGPVPFRKAALVLWPQKPAQLRSLRCLSAQHPASLQNVKLRPRKSSPAFEKDWPPPLCRDCRHLPCPYPRQACRVSVLSIDILLTTDMCQSSFN